VSVQIQKGVQCIEHPLQIEDACHPLNFRERFRVSCWRDKGPDRPLHLEYMTLYSLLLETTLQFFNHSSLPSVHRRSLRKVPMMKVERAHILCGTVTLVGTNSINVKLREAQEEKEN
jgi:hypothetical protein